MNSSRIIGHIVRRELLDQWRDRRTLLTVIFLPLLLYPIVGLGMLQVSQFLGEKPTRVLVVGQHELRRDDWQSMPALFAEDRWHPELLIDPANALAQPVLASFSDPRAEIAAQQLLQLADQETPSTARWRELLQQELRKGGGDVLLWFAPPDEPGDEPALPPTDPMPHEPVAQSDPVGRPSIDTPGSPRRETAVATSVQRKPRLHLFQNSASDRSAVATRRVEAILNQWYFRSQMVGESPDSPTTSPVPFRYGTSNVAGSEQVNSQFWSKILPFILFLWTLTGAFYCAVDLCAGEKERGTLEALLVTPATRGQIVLGKLLTTMAFSFTSGMVNLLGTVTTGTFVAGQLAALAGSAGAPSFGPPPLAALGWLVIGAIPISALFSAVSVAVATFARSTKEGQHYLMPVLMICFPLLALPILPGLQLDLGMSLLPVSGLLFWLRALIEGQYSLAARYTIPVLFVNGWCVYLAIYWAIVQFNQESVLFRPVERFSLLAWVRSLLQRQAPLPSLGQVILLVALMFTLKLSLQWITPPPDNWTHFAWHTLLILIGAVALPAILLALTSTQSYTATLHLLPTSTKHLLSAVGLAVCFHPLILTFQQLVMNLYPLQMDTTPWQDSFSNLFSGAPGLWAILLLMAMAPAVCEELAFRGYILSGLRRWTTNLNAVLLTAILFGATHGLLQQSIVATATGIVLGFVAIRTGSLWPCIAYHAVHNALTLQFVFLDQEKIAQSRLYGFLLETQLNEQGQLIDLNYAGLPAAAMIISGIWICLNLAPSTDAPDATHLKALHPAAGPSVSA